MLSAIVLGGCAIWAVAISDVPSATRHSPAKRNPTSPPVDFEHLLLGYVRSRSDHQLVCELFFS